jgi:hypothetical protein
MVLHHSISRGAEIAIFEQPASQLPCARCNHHGARFSQCLEARSKVRRLADDRLRLGPASSDEVADHHEPGRDPDPYLQG